MCVCILDVIQWEGGGMYVLMYLYMFVLIDLYICIYVCICYVCIDLFVRVCVERWMDCMYVCIDGWMDG